MIFSLFFRGAACGLVSVFMVLGLHAQDTAPADAAKSAAIKEFLTVSGTKQAMDQMVDQMIGQMKQMAPQNMPGDFWEKASQRLKSGELLELLVPVYNQYYSTEDLQGLIAFYKTPLGKKMVASMPNIMRESYEVGNQWGQKVGMELMGEMSKYQDQGAAQTPGTPSTPSGK
jgi:hypothetical protein